MVRHLLLTLLLLTTINNSWSSESESYRFATHCQRPITTIVNELYTEVFNRMGKQFELVVMPGRRVVQKVNRGIFDGDAVQKANFKNMGDRNTRNYVLVKEPVLEAKLVMLTQKETDVANPSWKAVNQGNAAFLRGSKHIKTKVKQPLPADSIKQMMSLLINGRVHSAVMFSSMALSYLNQHPELKEKVVVHTSALEEFQLHSFLHHKHRHLAPKLSAALKQAKADGTYSRIMSKYN